MPGAPEAADYDGQAGPKKIGEAKTATYNATPSSWARPKSVAEHEARGAYVSTG